MRHAKILAFDSFTPEKVVTNDDLSKFIDTSDEWIYSRSGIKNRHISSKKEENNSYLATRVCERLLKRTGKKPEDIDLLIIATVSPDYMTPSTAAIVQGNIGASNAFCFDISAACAGFIYALSIADKFILGGKVKNAIVVGCEVLSKITDWDDRTTCVLFGDGAGGALVTAADEKGILAEDINTDGSRVPALYGCENPVRNPFCKPDYELQRYVKMDGRSVFDFAVKEVPKSIARLLDETGLTFENIKYIIPHQANSRIVDGIARKLKLSLDKFFVNIQDYGNTSSASIPIALTEMVEKGLLKMGSGDKIIISGFGAGLTWGSMLLSI